METVERAVDQVDKQKEKKSWRDLKHKNDVLQQAYENSAVVPAKLLKVRRGVLAELGPAVHVGVEGLYERLEVDGKGREIKYISIAYDTQDNISQVRKWLETKKRNSARALTVLDALVFQIPGFKEGLQLPLDVVQSAQVVRNNSNKCYMRLTDKETGRFSNRAYKVTQAFIVTEPAKSDDIQRY